MKKICCICKKEIKEKEDNYYKVELFRKGKKVGIDYAHESCWLNRNNFDSSLRNLIGGVTNYAKEQGIIKEDKKEEFILA